jgi:hypothetical protein
MHIDVKYKAEKVSLNDLIANKVDLGTAARIYRGDVNIIAALRGNLTQPKPPEFHFEFLSNSELTNDPTFEQFMAKLQHDENEMNKQVTYLLLFNSFAPYGEGRNFTQNLYSYAYKGLSDIINRQVNNIVNDLLFKITGNRNIKVDISTSVYSSANLLGSGNPVGGTLANLSRFDRSTVDLKVPIKLLKGKIIVNVGGNLDFAFQSNSALQNNNFQWLPDWDVEFVLGKSGKLRMIVFQRNSLDINTVNSTSSLGRRNRYGVSLSYSKDFD